MFAQSYYTPYFPSHETLSPRDRYLSALSRVRQAEVEYAAYLDDRQNEQVRVARARQAQLEYVMQQERARCLQAQQRHNEQAVKRMQMLVLHAAVSSLLHRDDIRDGSQEDLPADKQPKNSTPSPHGPQLQRRNHIRFVRRPKTLVDEPVPAVETALKRRLAVESNVEVHATIQNILSNLSSNSADADVAPESTAAIHRIARRLRILSSEFTFPSQLDFVSEASGSYTATQLPYTPRNAPVRHYENALNDLLSQLDAIDSKGNAAMRRQRKLVVGMVEKTIQDLDRIVEGRWKLQDMRGNYTRVDATAPTVAASTSVVNDESTTIPSAAITTDLPLASSTPQDESRSAQELSPVLSINEQGRASQPPVLSVEVEEQNEFSQGESSLFLASESATPITSDPQATEISLAERELAPTKNFPVDEEITTNLLSVPPSSPTPLSVSVDEESVTGVAAVDVSPNSLSAVVPLPDDDPVEEKDDSPIVPPPSTTPLSVSVDVESVTGIAAVDLSPKSLSIVMPLPDDDLVVEEKDDDSTSSWSERVTGVAAVDLSPKSLSVIVPLPDEDMVVVEEKDDDSTSSWSELED